VPTSAGTAEVALAWGDLTRAWTAVQEALRISQAVQDRPGIYYELSTLAGALKALGQPEGAAHLLAATDALGRSLGLVPTARHQRARAAVMVWCRTELDGPALEAALAAGAADPLDQLLIWVLAASPPAAETRASQPPPVRG
jgi:hypothetical protein